MKVPYDCWDVEEGPPIQRSAQFVRRVLLVAVQGKSWVIRTLMTKCVAL